MLLSTLHRMDTDTNCVNGGMDISNDGGIADSDTNVMSSNAAMHVG